MADQCWAHLAKKGNKSGCEGGGRLDPSRPCDLWTTWPDQSNHNMCIVQRACLVLNMVTLLLWLTVKYVKLAKPKRTRMRQRQSLWKATLCSSGWRMSGDLYLGTVLRRTTSCQLSTSERFIPEQAKGWKGQVWPQHLRWGRNLLLPPSTVCCNGGLGKEKAPLIMVGTPLSLSSPCQEIFSRQCLFHACVQAISQPNVFYNVFMFLCFLLCFYNVFIMSQYKHLC